MVRDVYPSLSTLTSDQNYLSQWIGIRRKTSLWTAVCDPKQYVPYIISVFLDNAGFEWDALKRLPCIQTSLIQSQRNGSGGYACNCSGCNVCSYPTRSEISLPFRHQGFISILLRCCAPSTTTSMLSYCISIFSGFLNHKMTLFDTTIAVAAVVTFWLRPSRATARSRS